MSNLYSREEFLKRNISESAPTSSKVTTETIDGEQVSITWELGEQLDDAGDGHCFDFEAFGEDESGNKYEGTATVCDGVIDTVADVEKK